MLFDILFLDIKMLMRIWNILQNISTFFIYCSYFSPAMISIVIPVGPNDTHIDFCLKAIEKSTLKKIEVNIVLDGWSRHFTPSLTKNLNLRVFELEKAGPAVCRNVGASRASYDILCFMDADVEVHPDTLSKAYQFIQQNKIDGAIGSYDNQPLHPQTVSRFRNLLHHYHHQKNHLQNGTFWGAFGMIEKQTFYDIGMFNTNYEKPSIEDIELGYRLLDNGYNVLINADLQIKHRKKWTLKNMVYTDIFLRALPWTQLINSYPNNPKILNINLKEKTSAAAALATSFFFLSGLIYSPLLILSIIGLISFLYLQRSFYSLIFKHFTFFQSTYIPLLHFLYYWCAFIGMTIGHIKTYLNKPK